MLVIPKNKIKIGSKYKIFKNEIQNNTIYKQHIYNYQKIETDIYAYENIPINLSNISYIQIEDIELNIMINNNDCIIQIGNNTPIVINNLTDKSQLLLKPQLIDEQPYWTIIYDNNIIDKFLAKKMPNNYIDNRMFEIKDKNVDENNNLLFEIINP